MPVHQIVIIEDIRQIVFQKVRCKIPLAQTPEVAEVPRVHDLGPARINLDRAGLLPSFRRLKN